LIYTIFGLVFLLTCAAVGGFAPRRAMRASSAATLAALMVGALFLVLTQR